jgi:hypothetical protein
MSSQKTSNNDSCRDLSGRRLSTIKEAKKLAEYLEGEPARKRAAADAQKAKLEALEKKLGINGSSGEASTSKPKNGVDPEPLAGKKHRFDDTEYLEQSREIVDTVKSAVAVGLLKKRKKAKTTHSPEAEATGVAGTKPVTTSVLSNVTEKVVESPATVSIAAAASGAVGA